MDFIKSKFPDIYTDPSALDSMSVRKNSCGAAKRRYMASCHVARFFDISQESASFFVDFARAAESRQQWEIKDFRKCSLLT